MSILSLPIPDEMTQKLDQLRKIFDEKEKLTKEAEIIIKNVDELENQKENLYKRAEKYASIEFKSQDEVKDFSDILIESMELNEKIGNKNDSSRELNEKFETIIEEENKIVSEIRELLKQASMENIEEVKSILVEKLGMSVFVIKPNIPDVLNVVDRSANEIINCEKNIVSSLSEIYFENSIIIPKKADKDYIKILKKYVSDSIAQQEQSIDERLSFLQKEPSEKVEEKQVVEQPKVEIPVENNNIQETVENKEEEKAEVVQENTSNILSLDSILSQDAKVETNAVIDSNIIIIKDRFDNSNSKVANSNKTKIENIKNNFKGTFVLPIIKSEIEPKVEVKPMDPITSFINPKAA